MSGMPVLCPNCYRTIPAPAVGSDGQILCDGCGHAFPARSAAAAPSAPPAFKPTPSYQPIVQSPANSVPSGKYQPVYPPASGPQKTGNPGLVACGIVALFGVMGLLCCGALSVVMYGLGNQQLANHDANMPAFNSNPNPPVAPQPPPVIAPPGIPNSPVIEPSPFEPVSQDAVTRAGVPVPKTLDDFLRAMQTIDPMNFTARQLLDDLNRLPVEEGRRGEVVDALLPFLDRAGIHASGLLAGPGETTLENWVTKVESTKVAEFAAETTNHFARLRLLQHLAKVGGDAQTAEALLPLLKDPVSAFNLPDVFEKIGSEAEDALLTEIDTPDISARRAIYASLAKIGGKKSAEKLQARINRGEGFDRVFGAQALSQIKSRSFDK